jgi:hypothetical protein
MDYEHFWTGSSFTSSHDEAHPACGIDSCGHRPSIDRGSGLADGGIEHLCGSRGPHPETSRYPLIAVFQIGFGIVALLISLFCGWTVVGLFRLQRWARYSVIVLGGALAIFSTLSAILFFALAFSPAISAPNASGMRPATMRIVSLAMAGFFLFVALIGVWWLVYFNLRRIREVFRRSGAAVPTFGEPGGEDGIVGGRL